MWEYQAAGRSMQSFLIFVEPPCADPHAVVLWEARQAKSGSNPVRLVRRPRQGETHYVCRRTDCFSNRVFP